MIPQATPIDADEPGDCLYCDRPIVNGVWDYIHIHTGLEKCLTADIPDYDPADWDDKDDEEWPDEPYPGQLALFGDGGVT